MGDVSPEDRFEALYRAHAGAVLAYCRRRNPSAAEDALAETFLVAWRRLDAVPNQELPWLLAVAHRVLANARRADARRAALNERAGSQREAVDALTAPPGPVVEALQRLAERDREVLRLHAWEGLSAVEAAEVLGCSAVAFRLRLHRARRRLERSLAEVAAEEARTSEPPRVAGVQGASK